MIHFLSPATLDCFPFSAPFSSTEDHIRLPCPIFHIIMTYPIMLHHLIFHKLAYVAIGLQRPPNYGACYPSC
ncbi:hypothetical protein L596_024173 [Steinernema carpocapsae]|uniref:Uncharacterized protein n=1 Tax=Steinernema carpocapsae TaxID=34508 RepID=A0A4U5MG76_STECR|nr:hypothetical protein L596_024173 [Steinernema carpocapsae]